MMLLEDFLINGTVRYEDYSEGGATVWKLSSEI
jgi:iron complex outermembrane receptor protein